MNILIEKIDALLPVIAYGGTERVVWYLGKELAERGHKVSFLVQNHSTCPFAQIITYDSHKTLKQQIPDNVDIIHFNTLRLFEELDVPSLLTVHGNAKQAYPSNSVFVSRNHANRFGSTHYVYNGIDWNDYLLKDYFPKENERSYFHFLGKAAWHVKNVKGAISIVESIPKAELRVLGGNRLNFKMGLRITFNPRIHFYGMVGGRKKLELMSNSKGLIFPVLWDEPFGLALTESMFMGAPVFGTLRGSLPEIVSSEVGFLSNDMDELREAIQSMHFNPMACREYATKYFNSQIMAESYLEKYKQIISQGFLT